MMDICGARRRTQRSLPSGPLAGGRADQQIIKRTGHYRQTVRRIVRVERSDVFPPRQGSLEATQPPQTWPPSRPCIRLERGHLMGAGQGMRAVGIRPILSGLVSGRARIGIARFERVLAYLAAVEQLRRFPRAINQATTVLG